MDERYGRWFYPSGDAPIYNQSDVASSVTQSGSVISGNIPQVAVINVDPGYQPDPDHPGTGTVISVDCPN